MCVGAGADSFISMDVVLHDLSSLCMYELDGFVFCVEHLITNPPLSFSDIIINR